MRTLLKVLSASAILAVGSGASATDAKRLDFNVFLDDKKIGTHIFELDSASGVRAVKSVANFKYTFLFITAYRYNHVNEERWSENCLLEITAETNANGKEISVSGARDGDGFRIERDDAPETLPQCVMTFAYWNPAFLQQERLLNQQTGKYVDVEVEELGTEQIEYRGNAVNATRFSVEAPEASLTLWYSQDNEWLALESVAKGGRIIRYERV